jgi:hypothetical protein
MFRKILAFILLLALTAQCLGTLGVLTWFGVNRSYIANILCENKDKPEMHCNGQCVLMKKLKKLDDSRKSDREVHISKTEVIMAVPGMLVLSEPEPTILFDAFRPYCSQYNYLYTQNLFLPPKIA